MRPPSLGVIEDEIVLKPMAIETPSAGCLLAGMKHMLPTTIWELLVGEFNPGTGMAAVHLGSDHHKACLKLSAWFKQNAPAWLLVFGDFCKQHASGLCISPLCHCWNILNPTTYCMAKQMRKHAVWQKFVKRGALFH